MEKYQRKFIGFGVVVVSSWLTMGAAYAMINQSNINIDGGPLGPLEMSGGVAGYGYVLTNNASNGMGYHQSGLRSAAMFLQLEKATGILQFTVSVGKYNTGGLVLGTEPTSISDMNSRSLGVVNLAYITIAPPNLPFRISAGNLSGLEGLESGTSWTNVSLFTTALCYTTTDNQTGANLQFGLGPASLTVQFGDVGDTHVFNNLELLGTYNFSSNNMLNLFASINLGRTGLNAHTKFAETSWASSAVGYVPALINANVFGAYDVLTFGSLNLVPEIQYIYARTDHKIGIDRSSTNFGLALFGDYDFSNSPYSLGGWVAWDKSGGPYISFIGQNDETIAAALAPTWQYKDTYLRANMGAIYLLNNRGGGVTYGFGSDNNQRLQLVGAMEAGFVF